MSFRYLILLILLVDINCFPIERPLNFNGKNALAYSTEVNVQCFSGDSLIKLSNGQEKQISYLKPGDKLLTIDKYKIVSTEFIFMLDKQFSKKALFYTIKTKSGSKISLTEYHLIPIKYLNKTTKYLFAKQIQIGDLLFILFNNQIEYSPVINITIEIKKGYYAPLTIQGTLLINQILSSCFAHTIDHHFTQFIMFPLRFYYQLTKFIHFNHPFYNHESQGLHWIISIIFHLTRYFRPQLLILS